PPPPHPAVPYTTLFRSFDTLGTLKHLRGTGHDYSWFVLTQKIIEKEFALSGSEQNPDLTGRDVKLLAQRLGSGAPGPVEAFKQRSEEHTSELQSRFDLVCRLLLEKK